MSSTMSPPESCPSSFSDYEDDDDFDDDYFFKTYVPLSNLPTPPLSSRSVTAPKQFPNSLLMQEDLDPELLGPAVHLTNLIPPSTSLTAASIPLVHTLLTRASLPREILALAVSILDSLNSRFSLAWRDACPLSMVLMPSQSLASPQPKPHIDAIYPEIIVLSALILAVKFLDDAQESTSQYSHEWGGGIWTCEQINTTQRVIMDNLGYRLLPLWEKGIISHAVRDMERAGIQYREVEPNVWDEWRRDGEFDGLGMSGKAVLGLGNQVTPAETPGFEELGGTKGICEETKKAFTTGLRREKKEYRIPERELQGFMSLV